MPILQQAETLAPGTIASGAATTTRLRAGGLPLAADAVAALFPDFRIERGPAAASELPFALLEQGLLRAPPYGRAAAPRLSAVALTLTGPASPADRLDPARVLASHGWESPALMQRSQAARRAMLAARVGGAWWLAGKPELPAGGDYALVILAEPRVAGSNGVPAEDVLAAMLDAALTENPPERVVVLAPGRTKSGLLSAKLAAAAARGARVIAGDIAPWAPWNAPRKSTPLPARSAS